MAILDSIYTTFYDGKFDKEHGYPKFGVQPLDYHYEKIYYGKVDRRQNAAYLSDANFTSQLEPGEPHVALDLVAEAFREFSDHFQKALATNRIAREGVFKNGLIVKKALIDLNQLHEIYRQNLYKIFETFLFSSKRNKKLKDFNDFVHFFREFIDTYASTTPITKTAFIKSKLAPRNISGLVIELEGGQFGDNKVKRRWVEDVNFDFYRNAAIKFGLYVDKSAPWCLIADVASYEIQNRWFESQSAEGDTTKVSKRGLIFDPGDASNLFEVYYNKSHRQDLDELAMTIITFYNTFVSIHPVVKIYKPVILEKMNKCGSTMIKIHERSGIDFETASGTFGAKYTAADYTLARAGKTLLGTTAKILGSFRQFNSFSYSMYLLCRIREEELEVSEVKQKQIIKKASFLEKHLDKTKALGYINGEIKKQISLKVNPSYCQNFEVCDESVKTKEELKHRKYVKSPLF